MKRLFVGGSRHGEMVDVPDLRPVEIPVVEDGPPVGEVYTRRRWIAEAADRRLHLVEVWVIDGLDDPVRLGQNGSRMVLDAITRAFMAEHGTPAPTGTTPGPCPCCTPSRGPHDEARCTCPDLPNRGL